MYGQGKRLLSQKSNNPVEDHHHQMVVEEDGCMVVKSSRSPAVAYKERELGFRTCGQDRLRSTTRSSSLAFRK